MLPMIILGASIGVMLNKIFPSVVIAVLLIVLLCIVSATTFKKILAIVRMEREKHGPVCGKKGDQEVEMAPAINKVVPFVGSPRNETDK